MSDQQSGAQLVKMATRSSSAAWFASKHASIYGKDKAAGLIKGPKCNSLQRKIQAVIDRFEDLDLPVRIIGLKPRQKGSTTFFTAVTYCFLRRKSANAVIIGGQFSQVEEAWGMWQTYQKNDTFDWGNTGEVNTKAGAWSHGSKLIGETARDVLAGVGGTHQVLHGFEVARWAKHGVANSAEVLGNLVKAIPNIKDSMIILESTAEGESGPFPSRYWGATPADKFLSGEADVQPGSFVSIFAAWFEFSDSAMRLTPEQQKHIQDTLDADDEYSGEQELIDLYRVIDEDGVPHLGEAVKDFNLWEQLAWRRWSIKEECERDKAIFDRDYPHSAKVAFQKSGNLRFNSTGLDIQRKRLAKRKPGTYGIIEEVKGQRRYAFRPTSKNEARVIIFENPIAGCRYIVSVDPMTGITQTGGKDPDWHSALVLRAGYWGTKGEWNRPAVVARVVRNRWDISVLEPDVWALSRLYGNSTGAVIVIEMNQDKGLTELLRLRGANFYQREIFNQREQKNAKAFGFQTNEKTRENLVEVVATAIREWDTPGAGVDIWDEGIIEQCENFVRKDNGRSEASEGHKDDDVFGIGLGLTVIEHATTYTPPRGITGWWGPPEMGGGPPPRPSAFS